MKPGNNEARYEYIYYLIMLDRQTRFLTKGNATLIKGFC